MDTGGKTDEQIIMEEPSRKNSEEAQRTTDRERAQLEKALPIDKLSLRKHITAKPPSAIQAADTNRTETEKDTSENTSKVLLTVKNYACDNCKICDEFEKSNAQTKCNNCGCDLIFHIR